MNADLLIILFPLLPLFSIVISLIVNYTWKKDISTVAVIVNSTAQFIAGLILIYIFQDFEGLYTVVLSEWKHSIELSFDSSRIFFLAAYLIPSLLTLFHHRKLYSYNVRIIFLFYLTGCSGLMVAGDIFNFYIFYEVMIMAAYMLIAVNGRYYASIKYMIIGAASSAVFLAGIILLYASGSYFSYSFIYNIAELNPRNIQIIFLFFSIAFFIKAAFFPVSGWVATCHSATNSLISCFLASFTIFSGILGMYYFVIIPAGIINDINILMFIELLSLLTIVIPSVILFFEPDLKRCIAGSSVITIGFIGLLLANGLHKPALMFLAVHAVYKSYMFLINEDFTIENNEVSGNTTAIIAFLISVFFTVGLFPALTYFIKYTLLTDQLTFKLLTYISMLFVLGSFFKFSYRIRKKKVNLSFYLLFPVMLAVHYALYPFSLQHSGFYLFIDLTVLLTALFAAKHLFNRLQPLHCLDTKYVFININYELLYIVMLFIVQIMMTRILS